MRSVPATGWAARSSACPRFYELHHRSRDMDELWGIPLVRARRGDLAQRRTWRVKRDGRRGGGRPRAGAAVAGADRRSRSRCDSRSDRSVLFRQVRVGLDDEPFTLLKFRSLRPVRWSGCDAPSGRSTATPASDRWAASSGRTSLDELPQLFNIVRGEMSIVGPRPERPPFVEEFTERDPALHRAAPDAGRSHRLGAGQRTAGRHLDRGAGPLRQLLHPELVAVVRRQDRRADDLRRCCSGAARDRGAARRPGRGQVPVDPDPAETSLVTSPATSSTISGRRWLIAPEWEALADTVGAGPLARPSYALSWWRHLGRGRLLVATVRREAAGWSPWRRCTSDGSVRCASRAGSGTASGP